MNDYELSERHMRAVYTHREPLSLAEIRGEYWDRFIARVKADALRKAATDFEDYWTTGAPVGNPPEVWLRNLADKIEGAGA